jgi:iron complex outermembrane receptor protein
MQLPELFVRLTFLYSKKGVGGMQKKGFLTAAIFGFWVTGCFFGGVVNGETTQTEEVKAFEKMFGKGPQEEDVYRTDRLLLTATRHMIPVKQAPAIATVVSSEEIRRMGARNLLDVLERIPGFGVTRGYFSLYEVEIRGLKTDRSEKVRLMVDGHTLNYPVWGGAAWAYDTISLDHVERIEIIRGPGSALYGANAFSGTINVITQTGNDLGGTIASAGIGSYGTQQYHLAHGKRYSDVDFLIYSTVTNSAGDNLYVESDLVGQSGFTDDQAKSIDFAVKAVWQDVTFNSRMLKRENGPYVGVKWTLNDESQLETEQYFADISYVKELNEQWSVNSKIYGDYLDIDLNWEILPEGIPLALGMGALGWGAGDSLMGTPSMKNSRYGVELGFSYEPTDNNKLTMGTVYERVRHYDLEHHANFNPLTSEMLASFQDISSWGNWGLPGNREILAFYLQDEWEVAPDVRLTVGARYDHYSDFGDVTSPRIGMVWNISRDAELKLLYGEAFRAPNFEELYLTNNPATLGNPALQPEKMKTYEMAIGYRPCRNTEMNISGFLNKFEDRIDFVSIGGGVVEAQNSGDATIQGLELDVRHQWQRVGSYLNYTWQEPEDDASGQRLADVPSYRWNLGLDCDFSKNIIGDFHVLTVGDRPRAAGDSRGSLDSYTVANASVSISDFGMRFLDLQLSLYNLFNAEYSYPAAVSTLSKDFPAPARTFFLEARYTF